MGAEALPERRDGERGAAGEISGAAACDVCAGVVFIVAAGVVAPLAGLAETTKKFEKKNLARSARVEPMCGFNLGAAAAGQCLSLHACHGWRRQRPRRRQHAGSCQFGRQLYV